MKSAVFNKITLKGAETRKLRRESDAVLNYEK